MVNRPLVLTEDLLARSAEVEAAVRTLVDSPSVAGLEGLARFLLRSEAVASSRIEGLQVSPQQLALAEFALGGEDVVEGFSGNARQVVNNIVALRRALTELAGAKSVTCAGILDLHRALLPDHPSPGLRTAQNWLGGSDWHPLDAEFVPPPEIEVGGLMADLAAYASGGVHAPLIQAGLVHAQFETIHPFDDGNGRVGRALIHTILTRRGLVRSAVLPVSLVLLTTSEEYVAGLTAYRYSGSAGSDAARAGVSRWLGVFLDAVAVAVEQARLFSEEIAQLRLAWEARLSERRTAAGVRTRPRADSATARLLAELPGTPLMTAGSAARLLNVSEHSARVAAEKLVAAGIVHRKKIGRGTTGYLAREVFDLLAIAERRPASTRWDTRESGPRRASPVRPGLAPDGERVG
jgi:Fic family protein